jgi:hypothetical protein
VAKLASLAGFASYGLYILIHLCSLLRGTQLDRH